MKKKTNTSHIEPKNENGLVQLITMGKSIRHKWVMKQNVANNYINLISASFLLQALTTGTDFLTNKHTYIRYMYMYSGFTTR